MISFVNKHRKTLWWISLILAISSALVSNLFHPLWFLLIVPAIILLLLIVYADSQDQESVVTDKDQEMRDFVRDLARKPHSGDDGYVYHEDAVDPSDVLDPIVAKARDLI